jgi:hypoxanthine phosphoribosyltransferase
MFNDVEEVVFSETQIQERIKNLCEEIAAAYEKKSLLLVGILKGCLFFMADLMRSLNIPLAIDFISISSYGSSTEKTGAVKILKDLDTPIQDKHVLIVEDIVDTGLTLGYLLRNLRERAPASLQVCSLLDKPDCRIVQVPVNFKGFELGKKFVVGYGLDYQGKYRHLPFIASLKKEICPF